MEGNKMIEFKNPLGFENYSSEDTIFNACMCASGFAGEKGTSDNCSHCGWNCNAGAANDNANYNCASTTNRAS